MIRVICIDAGEQNPETPLINGNIYTASQCSYYPNNYDIAECPKDLYGNLISFLKRRFIPLSTIDEMELLHNRQTELV